MSGQIVLWAMGGRNSTDVAHAYLSEDDYEAGRCLCGRIVKPYLKFDHWNLDENIVREHTCQQCRERLKLLEFM